MVFEFYSKNRDHVISKPILYKYSDATWRFRGIHMEITSIKTKPSVPRDMDYTIYI